MRPMRLVKYVTVKIITFSNLSVQTTKQNCHCPKSFENFRGFGSLFIQRRTVLQNHVFNTTFRFYIAGFAEQKSVM